MTYKHRGPTHSLTCLAVWAAIAAPLYMASAGVVMLTLAWAAGKLTAIAHMSAPMHTPAPVPCATQIPGRRVPVRRRDHGPRICLASGARLAHRSDSLGLANRSLARRAPACCAQDPHWLGDRD